MKIFANVMNVESHTTTGHEYCRNVNIDLGHACAYHIWYETIMLYQGGAAI